MPAPNASDIFSVEVGAQIGGWYLDLDQLVLKNLDGLSQHYDFIAGGQTAIYIGVFGITPGSKVAEDFYKRMMDGFSQEHYNSSGISAILRDCIHNNEWLRWFRDPRNGTNHIVNQEMFYPLFAHNGSNEFWGGNYDIVNRAESYCVHYYGGNPVSLDYFHNMTPENIFVYKDGNSCMSKYIKKLSNGGQSYKKILCFE
jgi:mannosyltransferase OCH1-like enzyme